jgi:hypothetical protein
MSPPSRTLGAAARRWSPIVCLLAVTVVLSSCYPGGPTDLSELDVVVTSYDVDFDFTKPKTYALPDSVAHLGDPSEPGYVDLPRTYDALILQRIEAEMNAFGWTREMSPETNGADVFVLPSAVGATTWVLTSYYPGYGGWGWYPGWGYYPGWGPGWGWGYPPYYSATSYKTGTLFIDMVDPNAADADEMTIPVRWTGTLSAVLGSSSVGADDRITRGIHQAYEQSPYLRRN